MKKLVFSLVLLASVAAAQPGFAAVIDQCPYGGSEAWKCHAIRDYMVDSYSFINQLNNAWEIFWGWF